MLPAKAPQCQGNSAQESYKTHQRIKVTQIGGPDEVHRPSQRTESASGHAGHHHRHVHNHKAHRRHDHDSRRLHNCQHHAHLQRQGLVHQHKERRHTICQNESHQKAEKPPHTRHAHTPSGLGRDKRKQSNSNLVRRPSTSRHNEEQKHAMM